MNTLEQLENQLKSNTEAREAILRELHILKAKEVPPKEPCICGKPACTYEKFVGLDGATHYGCGNDDCSDCYGD